MGSERGRDEPTEEVHRKLLGGTDEGGCCTNTATGARPSSEATGGGLALDKRPAVAGGSNHFHLMTSLGGGVPL